MELSLNQTINPSIGVLTAKGSNVIVRPYSIQNPMGIPPEPQAEPAVKRSMVVSVGEAVTGVTVGSDVIYRKEDAVVFEGYEIISHENILANS